MKPTRTLLAGPVAAVIFAATVLLLPLGIPGYSSVHQTVSEIGMVGSPMRVPFTVLVCLVALLLLVFGLALHTAARDAGQSSLAGYLTICAAISAAGVLVQRSLFAAFFLWCAVIGAMLFGAGQRRTPAGTAATQAV